MIEETTLAQSLQGRAVFLSASFPAQDRAPEFFETADPGEITQAVVALARAVFSVDGRLVFGGHPTISPLVMSVSQDYTWQMRLQGGTPEPLAAIYQSEIFRDFLSPATVQMMEENLGNTIFTGLAPEEEPLRSVTQDPQRFPHSLLLMRQQMLSRDDLVAGIFVGGMEGIRAESELLTASNPFVPQFFLGAPGGAARILAAEAVNGATSAEERGWRELLLNSGEYVTLVQRILMRATR